MMADIGPEFELQWDNYLGCECGNPLNEGDMGGYVNGELVCGVCRTEAVNDEECLLKKQIENRRSG